MNDAIETFRRCPNCGRYYTPDQSAGEVCSAACAVRYVRCVVCGRYYPENDGVADNRCSETCAQVYVQAPGIKNTYVLMEETV